MSGSGCRLFFHIYLSICNLLFNNFSRSQSWIWILKKSKVERVDRILQKLNWHFTSLIISGEERLGTLSVHGFLLYVFSWNIWWIYHILHHLFFYHFNSRLHLMPNKLHFFAVYFVIVSGVILSALLRLVVSMPTKEEKQISSSFRVCVPLRIKE